MLQRCWGLAVLGIVTLALVPCWGMSQTTSSTYNKDAVKALSKKIDAHLAKVWKTAKVTPSPKAEDHVFFRRLNLDLAGRIPDLLQITDFVDDDSPDKRWLWVDRMLDGQDHPRHFANVWRSIMLGYQTNQQFQFLMPQFELWLKERVERNMGLDKVVEQLLTSQQNPGMGFPGGGFDGRFAGSPQLFFQANENKAENLAAATSRVFLGVKIECAQCHAHPFAKWKKEQFWEFAAFYSAPTPQVRRPGIVPVPIAGFQPGREIQIPGTQDVVKAKFLNGEEPKWEGTANSRKILSDWVTSSKNPYFARAMADHLWTYLMGVGLLEPIMEPNDDSPITHPDLLNDLAKALIDNNFDAKFLIRAIVHSDAYQRSSGGVNKLADKEDYQLFVRMPIRSLSPEQIFDSVAMATRYEERRPTNPNQPFFNPNQLQTPRGQFLTKFQNQDRRHEPQTSILQALFMMNGNFMAERTKLENNQDLRDLATQPTDHARRVRSLYMMVLSRPPRAEETTRLVRYLEQNEANSGQLGRAVSDVYWALLNSSEFLHNH